MLNVLRALLTYCLIATCAAQNVSGGGGQGGTKPLPAAPRVYIDTTWNPPSGTVRHAHTASDFSAALLAAAPCDTIVLDAGSTYSGNFVLPVKQASILKRAGTGLLHLVGLGSSPCQLYIETSALSTLPAPGLQVSPSNAPSMPKITTPNTSAPISLAPGANHYRLVGLEITSNSTVGGNPTNNPPSNNFTWCLVCWSPAIGLVEPDSITIDRSYLHGSPTQDVGQGVQANGSNFAVIDSYISDIHNSTADSQAVLVYWSPGPIKIVDNYLSATTEDVLFGEAGGYNDPYVPSDIEIRRNHFYKPLIWDKCGVQGTIPAGSLQPNGVACPAGTNNQWVEKNNLEFKSAQRVVVTGNVMENTWVSGQTGSSLLFTTRTSQSGNIAVVDDILVQSNLFTNVDAGIGTLEQDDDCGAQWGYPQCTNPGESRRIWVDNNQFLLSPNQDTSQHDVLKLDGGNATHPGETDFICQHNTGLMSDGSTLWSSVRYSLPQLSWGCSPPDGFSSTHNVWIIDNALTQQPDGDCGLVDLFGVTGLGYYQGDPAPLQPRFFGNVLYAAGGHALTYPANNDVVTTAPTWTNPATGNYQLLTPQWTDTTDGKLAGINWVQLQAAQSNSGGVGVSAQ